jgi:hypothetical protein
VRAPNNGVLTAARSRLFLGITSTDTKEKTLYPEKRTRTFLLIIRKNATFSSARQWSGEHLFVTELLL